ncbi:hypothetical protein ABZ464_07960 [Streptomyces sp. NPDC005820]|uniref:phosphoribosyltransferase-like protein n=1 Tax=Streptomyces sp. NPDC005820 TaxID=3157069 RepID=UPI0033FBC093
MDRPSNTRQGAAWLDNFLPEEKPLAELMLNSLQVCFDSTLRAGLARLLRDVAGNLPNPIAAVPVRELRESDSSGQAGEVDAPDGGVFPPLDQPFLPLAGSEGMVGNVIRESLGLRPDEGRLNYPESINHMKQVRTRSVLLVEDYCGTGSRVQGYVAHWMKNKTIRSWHSYGFIRFHVVAYAVSPRALVALNSNPKIASVQYSVKAADFASARWASGEAGEIRSLCRKYAKINSMALGYGNSESLFVMQHTVPNNTPVILWQNAAKGGRLWTPLFADRRMSPEIQEEWSDYVLEERVAQASLALRHRETPGDLMHGSSGASRLVVEILQAAEEGIRDAERLAHRLGVAIAQASHLRAMCVQTGLLDMMGRLTDVGRRELKNARPEPEEPKKASRLIGSDLPYYPRSLRGVGDI